MADYELRLTTNLENSQYNNDPLPIHCKTEGVPTGQEILLQVARELGISKPKIESRESTDKGDNYMVYKAAPTNDCLRRKVFTGEAFSNEILMYSEIIPLMRKFQEERNVTKIFDAAPKCYYTNAKNLEECLIFENLKTSGYSMWNRKVPMNKAHIISVFKVYARLHATATALKHHKPEEWKRVSCKIHDILKLHVKDGIQLFCFEYVTKRIKNNCRKILADKNLSERFSTFCENILPTIVEISNVDIDHSVLIHGDSWCNNMLFKYKDSDNTEPEVTTLIDWQLLRIAPGVCELSCFLYACGSKEIFKDLDELLEIYHQTFVKHARELGTTNVLSLETLKNDWINYGKFGLIVTFVILKNMISEGGEAPDVTKISNSGADIIGAFNYETKNEAEFYSRVEDVIVHCYERGII